MTVSLEQMNTWKCEDPNCDHEHPTNIEIMPGCHPGAPVRTVFYKEDGLIHIYCEFCRSEFITVAVAEKVPDKKPVARHLN